MTLASWHGAENHLLAALEDQNDGLGQTRVSFESEPQAARRPTEGEETRAPKKEVDELERVNETPRLARYRDADNRMRLEVRDTRPGLDAGLVGGHGLDLRRQS